MPVEDTAILAARHALYVQARERNPARWSRDTRNWSPVGAVTLNPERDAVVSAAADGPHTQQMAA
jgi:putative transposase